MRVCGGIGGDIVTWRQAEQALLEAVEYLARLPDGEARHLRSGSRSCWPVIVRDVFESYGQGEAAPASPGLTRRQYAHCAALLLGVGDAAPLANAIPEDRRVLVGRVIAMRLCAEGEVSWPGVWLAERAAARRAGGRIAVTSDGLRKRYDRAIGMLAQAMTAAGWQRREAA